MSDLRALAENIKAARDERRALTQIRNKEVSEQRRATLNLLLNFAETHRRLTKQDAQNRAAELNSIRARANALQAESRGLMKTFEQERHDIAQTLLNDAKELRRKLNTDNEDRINTHKNLMSRIGNEHQAVKDKIRLMASDVQRNLKQYEQLRREGREAWNRLLGGGVAQATTQEPTTDSPFAINIPFAPEKKKRRK